MPALSNLGQFCSYYIAPVHSVVLMRTDFFYDCYVDLYIDRSVDLYNDLYIGFYVDLYLDLYNDLLFQWPSCLGWMRKSCECRWPRPVWWPEARWSSGTTQWPSVWTVEMPSLRPSMAASSVGWSTKSMTCSGRLTAMKTGQFRTDQYVMSDHIPIDLGRGKENCLI